MAVFQTVNGKLVPLERTTFAKAGYKEREDLQQLLKQQIEVIAPETLIIAEEFGEWEDSRRRIDLLAIDKSANLVVVELKRTEDGGHMELQAIRYAAMVSTLTFDAAVDVFQKYLRTMNITDDARSRLLEFLEWENANEEQFAQDVRIVLAGAEFSREITTAVLWLNDRDLDIRCVRLSPYKDGNRLLIDVQQVVPLPEAQDYQIKIREKKVVERVARTQDRDMTRYDVTVGDKTFSRLPKRKAIYQVIRSLCDGKVDPERIRSTVTWRGNTLCSVDGELDATSFEDALAKQLIALGNKPETYRYFIAEEELIRANGKTYAVSKMWGARTSEAMATLIQTFPGHDIAFNESQ
jgi:hypothetical protein